MAPVNNYHGKFACRLQETLPLQRVTQCTVKLPYSGRADEWASIRQKILTRFPRPHGEAWSEFCRQYWQPIYQVARRSGLSSEAAEEVVVELVTMAAPHLADFQAWASRGLRSWVRETTKWRIQHRLAAENAFAQQPVNLAGLEKAWDEEWQSGLRQIALGNVREKVSPQAYQVYDLWILRHWPLAKLRATLGMSLPHILVAGFRVKRLVERELKRLEHEPL